MWCKAMLWIASCFCSLIYVAPASAALPDVVAAIKPSIVAVGSYQRTRSPAFLFFGTGFVVGDGTLIATNAHVRARTLNTEQFETLVVQIPDADGRGYTTREASRVSVDEQHDLALLKLRGGAPLPALRLATTVAREGQPIALMGFPLGNTLGLYPAVQGGLLSAIAPVSIPAARAGGLDAATIRQIASGNFQLYVLDAVARPGNSGSPVVNVDTGEVIGVVSAGQVRQAHEPGLGEPTGITYAIPVEHLQRLLRDLK